MAAQALLNEIFKTQKVYDESGISHVLAYNLDEKEGAFIQNLIKKYKLYNTIEIGCAFGISSLFICAALEDVQGAHHTIIDPAQSSHFFNVGLNNLRRAKIDFFTFYESMSHSILPRLLAENKKFDLALIDGDHRFEYTLNDFFYLSKLLNVGGVILIDDCMMPSVNKAVRYILNYSEFKQIGRIKTEKTTQRKLLDNVIKLPFRLLSKMLPAKMKYELFSGSVMRTDKALNLDSSIIALQKIKEDDRTWDWYKEF
jgi:predicted O-methyltransferase YrrM